MAVNNPLIALGTLNRLRGGVTVPLFPSLNVTGPYLGKRGVRLNPIGQVTAQLEVMVGTVPSPEPYLMIDVMLNLLKTNGLAALWQAQAQSNSVIGRVTVHSDTSQYPDYTLYQCSITNVAPESFAGDEPNADFTIQGYWPTNNTLWNLA